MNLPNWISLSRLLAIPLLLYGLRVGTPLWCWISLGVFLVAAGTDWLDGYLARRLQQVTELGRFLDPLVDKLLVLAPLLAFVERGPVPAWGVFLILARELAIAGWRVNQPRIPGANVWGKGKTIVQMVAIALLMVPLPPNYELIPAITLSGKKAIALLIALPPLNWAGLVQLVFWLAVALTLISGGVYLWPALRASAPAARLEEERTTDYFNDSPIQTAADDQYGMLPFAQSLADGIQEIKNPVGATIALNGPWGSGKSSAINLIREDLEKEGGDTLTISEFKCWWYRGEEALALAFLQNLNALLTKELGDKVKDFIPKLSRSLLQAGPVIGSILALTPAASVKGAKGVVDSSFAFVQQFFPKGDTLEIIFRKLSKALEQENRRFLIIIDDIDRLNPEEALAIFRIVKSVGRLPNVMYLLAFDRILAEKAVKERYPSEGPHFLEKIIQASFEVPVPLRTDLDNAILSSIEMICGSSKQSDTQRIMNIFHDVVAPYLTTPRHVVRFQNAISVTWPAIGNQISLADFLALETLRLYEPYLFQSIRSNKLKLCGINNDAPKDDARFLPFLSGVAETNHETAKLALQRLFPRLEKMSYDRGFLGDWDVERRVCIGRHFDTYFQLYLSEDSIPMEEINELVQRADDREFIQLTFREAADTEHRTGTSMVPVFLDELCTHAPKIEKAKVKPFLSALFEIHDEIDLARDSTLRMNTTLRYYPLIHRLMANRFNVDERTELYMATVPHAPLGWHVNFVSFAKYEYREQENKPQSAEDCLVREDVIEELVNGALHAIRKAAKDKSLLGHRHLIYILGEWKYFLGNDATEVQEWTNSLLNSEADLVTFAKELIGPVQSYNIGMFGLGDRVPKLGIKPLIDDTTDIIDVTAFIKGLERLAKSDLDDNSREIVEVFLDAWQWQQSGERREFMKELD